MKKVKITFLKTMLNEELAKEYGIPGLKACPMMMWLYRIVSPQAVKDW